MSRPYLIRNSSRAVRGNRQGVGTVVVAMVLAAVIGGVLATVTARLGTKAGYDRNRQISEQLEWIFEAAYERAALQVLNDSAITHDQWSLDFPTQDDQLEKWIANMQFARHSNGDVNITILLSHHDAPAVPLMEKSFSIQPRNRP